MENKKTKPKRIGRANPKGSNAGGGNPKGTNAGGGWHLIDPFTDEENLNKLKALTSYGLNVEQLAGIFKMSRASFYNLMEKNPQIKTWLNEGRAIGIAQVTKSLMRKAMEGDTTAAIFYLKCQAGWKDRTEIIHTGSVKHEIELEAVKRIDAMSPEQQAQRLKELESIESLKERVIDVEVD